LAAHSRLLVPPHRGSQPGAAIAAGVDMTESAARARRRRRHSWTLARVWRTNRAAPVVYLALELLGGGKAVVTPTRAALARATGITRLPTISAALLLWSLWRDWRDISRLTPKPDRAESGG